MENIIEGQLTVDELIGELSEKLKTYIWDERLNLAGAAKNAKVSSPMISEICQGKVGNISMDKMIQVANSIGYKVTAIKLVKSK